MSRYRLTTPDPRYTVIVGWDHPLETYFAQVFDTTAETDDDAAPGVLCIGTELQEIRTVEVLQTWLQPFAMLPSTVVRQLQHDRAATPPRTPHQEDVRQWLWAMASSQRA